MERRQFCAPRGNHIKEKYRPFTVRFTQENYEKLLARSQKNHRSVAAEVELIVQEAL